MIPWFCQQPKMSELEKGLTAGGLTEQGWVYYIYPGGFGTKNMTVCRTCCDTEPSISKNENGETVVKFFNQYGNKVKLRFSSFSEERKRLPTNYGGKVDAEEVDSVFGKVCWINYGVPISYPTKVLSI